MRHPVLPQKKTIEQLAQWLTENQIDKIVHETERPLTEEEIHQAEQKITHTTAALYDLDNLLKEIKETFKSGTDMDPSSPKDETKFLPKTYTIPPTKGTKELEENRKHADELLKSGKKIDRTDLYGIPYGQDKVIVFFDITGLEYVQYTRDMTPEQLAGHGGLFDEGVAKSFKKSMNDLHKKGTDVSAVIDGKEIPLFDKSVLDDPNKETPLFSDDANPLDA